jgi:oligopeptide transport system ATP-binding protein
VSEPLLSVRGLGVRYALPASWFGKARQLQALASVSVDLAAGETLGVVGESGSGKSTLGRAILRLVDPSEGSVLWQGRDLARLDEAAMRRVRRDMQLIFQDPFASLDPRMTIGETIAEPLTSFRPELARQARKQLVGAMLERVGLSADIVGRYPHEFSGGQCQRIGIARAMILGPKLVVCDEPVSALDLSIQAQIVNLLLALQQELGLSLLFISHNLGVVKHVSHRIAVLYLGRLVELGPAERLFATPRHPYTKGLIAAVPLPDPAAERSRVKLALIGEPPSPLDPPSGCAFRTRCPFATALCTAQIPELERVEPGAAAQWVACHHWRAIAATESAGRAG